MKDEISKNHLYWLAINGASCAMSNMPMPATVTVTPRPQMLVGFLTHADAKTAQHCMLTAPITKCRRLLKEWKKRDDVVMKVFKNSERPTHGPTIWRCHGEGDGKQT